VDVRDRKQYLFDLLLMTVVTIWGFNFAVMKLVYRWFHPIAFNAVRFVIASAVMVVLLKLLGIPLRMDRQDFRGIGRLGFVSNAMYPFVFVLGLARTKAGNAALFMALTPIFAYLIGVFKKQEKLSFSVLVGIVISLGGVMALILFGSGEVSFGMTWTGDLLMVTSAFLWGWYSAEQTRFLPKYGAIRLTVFSMLLGTAMLIPLSIPWVISQDWSAIAPRAWIGLGYSALLSIVYSYFIWAYALSRIGVAHTSVFNNVTPIIALIGGWLLLGEEPSAAQLTGVVLVLTGVFMVRSRKPTAVPDE
jgi:drug/metabolite transporter (DMT)-like permease